jgi:hypothetical protein
MMSRTMIIRPAIMPITMAAISPSDRSSSESEDEEGFLVTTEAEEKDA